MRGGDPWGKSPIPRRTALETGSDVESSGGDLWGKSPFPRRTALETGSDVEPVGGKAWEKLPPEFYLRDTLTVARNLLGRYLVRESEGGRLCCRITETEAYCGPSDPACHSYKGSKSGRTNVMYREGGLSYVYLIYGMYCCFNVVTRPEGEPEAVLIRSAQPVLGVDRMMENRRNRKEKSLLTGPGKLCMGMEIDRSLYGEPLWGDKLWLAFGEPVKDDEIAATPRINIDYAGEAAVWPWRFVEKNSGFLSVKYRGD